MLRGHFFEDADAWQRAQRAAGAPELNGDARQLQRDAERVTEALGRQVSTQFPTLVFALQPMLAPKGRVDIMLTVVKSMSVGSPPPNFHDVLNVMCRSLTGGEEKMGVDTMLVPTAEQVVPANSCDGMAVRNDQLRHYANHFELWQRARGFTTTTTTTEATESTAAAGTDRLVAGASITLEPNRQNRS